MLTVYKSHQHELVRVLSFIQDIMFFTILFIYLFLAQDVIMPVSTVVAVTFLAPQTVKTARATCRVERVLTVYLDGLDYIVKQVIWLTKSPFMSIF